MCRVKGPVHDALVESGLVDVVGAQHFYDSVRAAKKGRAPDGLPVVPEAGTTRMTVCAAVVRVSRSGARTSAPPTAVGRRGPRRAAAARAGAG